MTERARVRLPVAMRGGVTGLVEEGDKLFVEALGQRWPVDIGVLSLTSRCNVDCVMCLEPPGAGRNVDLPFEDAMRFVESFAGRVPKIWSCAGEALLYPRFFEIATEIKKRGSLLGVGTNGLALAKPGVIERCAAAGVKWLHISCHTSRAERFAELTGAGDPSLFATFLRALDAIDAHNRDHAADERFEVILQLVLMRPFPDEIADYLALVEERLSHTPVSLRVEPMQTINRASGRPDLRLRADELASAVTALVDAHRGRFELVFKSVPLCMLEGHEQLSEDVRTTADGSYQVGNVGSGDGTLQIQCPIGDPRLGPFHATHCGRCSLADLCPGFPDVDVPQGSAFPRVASIAPEEVLRRAGLPERFRRRERAPEFPVFEGKRTEGASPARREATGGPAFSEAQRARVEQLVEALRARVSGLHAEVGEGEAVLRFGSPSAGGKGRVVTVEPSAPGRPRFREVDGFAVSYQGELTADVRRDLAIVESALREAREPECKRSR